MPQVKYSAEELMKGIIKVLNLVKNKSKNPGEAAKAVATLKEQLKDDSTLSQISQKDLDEYKAIIKQSIKKGGLDPTTVDIDDW